MRNILAALVLSCALNVAHAISIVDDEKGVDVELPEIDDDLKKIDDSLKSPDDSVPEIKDELPEIKDKAELRDIDKQHEGYNDVMKKYTKDIEWLTHPTVDKVIDAKEPPGKWKKDQKLTVETFDEVVTTDMENVWVVVYIDPRNPDCYTLSIEWEKLTTREEKEMRKVKLGYVDISVRENWKILQDHSKGSKIIHVPAITMYG